MRLATMLCVVLAASAAFAHDVPVNPSTCTFDPLELIVADTGAAATVAAPTAADAMRIPYTVAASTAQFQQRIVAPRGFTIAGVAGTIAFPQAFNAQVTARGDLSADGVALTFVLGGAEATVPVRLTTAIVRAGGDVAVGAPMSPDGRFELVGSLPAAVLPAPLDASGIVLRLGCRANGPPDLDQFAAAPALDALAGKLSAAGATLRATLRGGTLTAATLGGGPAIVHLEAAGGGSATFEFPDGLAPQGARLLVAETSDGARLTVRLGKGRSPARFQAVLPGPRFVPSAAAGSTQIDVTLVAGSVVARGGRPFRARGGTLRGRILTVQHEAGCPDGVPMPGLGVMGRILAATIAAATLLAGAPAGGQVVPLYHGALKIRPAPGGIDRDLGTGSLRVNNWDLLLISDSNGVEPDREPIIIALGETERLVIPAGELQASPNGKRFTYRNPTTERGVRFFQMRRLRNDAGAKARYRLRFSLVGIDLSGLLIEYPLCKAMAIIVGDDDGFTGVDLDRPGGFTRSRVRVLGACEAEEWPWA